MSTLVENITEYHKRTVYIVYCHLHHICICVAMEIKMGCILSMRNVDNSRRYNFFKFIHYTSSRGGGRVGILPSVNVAASNCSLSSLVSLSIGV